MKYKDVIKGRKGYNSAGIDVADRITRPLSDRVSSILENKDEVESSAWDYTEG
jgi:hypothetical protein